MNGEDFEPTQIWHKLEIDYLSLNQAGHFVGTLLKKDREHAVAGRLLGASLAESGEKSWQLEHGAIAWKRRSGATSINNSGTFVGWRDMSRRATAFVCRAGKISDLEAPSLERTTGYLATSINDSGEIIGRDLDKPDSILVWNLKGALLRAIEVDFGSGLKITNSGQILCSFGVWSEVNQFWLPNAPGCGDFLASDINDQGFVVGTGRMLNVERGAHTSGFAACIWGPNDQSWRLDDLVDTPAPLGLREATAINGKGWIAADGFVLVPDGCGRLE